MRRHHHKKHHGGGGGLLGVLNLASHLLTGPPHHHTTHRYHKPAPKVVYVTKKVKEPVYIYKDKEEDPKKEDPKETEEKYVAEETTKTVSPSVKEEPAKKIDVTPTTITNPIPVPIKEDALNKNNTIQAPTNPPQSNLSKSTVNKQNNHPGKIPLFAFLDSNPNPNVKKKIKHFQVKIVYMIA